MDPMSVVRILWRHKLVASPFIVLTIAVFVAALFYGPRTYQATSSFAMITPSLPSPAEIEENPSLSVATDNPYLRSSDPTLVLQVGKTRLSSSEALDALQADGLSTDFAVGAGLSTSSQILSITATAANPEIAIESASRLGQILDEQIRQVQLVNGASDRYLITVQTINEASEASERVSSRLRNAAVAGIGGIVLLIASVAIARGFDERRRDATVVTPRPPAHPAPPVSPQANSSHPVTGHPSDPVQRGGPPPRPLPPQRAIAPRSAPPRIAPARPNSAAPVRRMGSGPTPAAVVPQFSSTSHQHKGAPPKPKSDSAESNPGGRPAQTTNGQRDDG